MGTQQETKQHFMEKRRAQILDAALAVFCKKGFSEATTREIAQEAGIAEGTIYNYFQSKRELLVSLTSSQVLSEGFLNLLESDLWKDFAMLLHSLIEHRLALGFERGDTLAVLLAEIQRDPELRMQFVDEVIQPSLRLMESRLETRVASGELRPMNVAVLARAMVGMVIGFVFLHKLEREKSPIERVPRRELAAELTNLFLLGLKGDRFAS